MIFTLILDYLLNNRPSKQSRVAGQRAFGTLTVGLTYSGNRKRSSFFNLVLSIQTRILTDRHIEVSVNIVW
jgi:hypothetical protein